MHPLVYVMLLGGALAHYRSYDERNLIEREVPETMIDGVEVVECPVCENSDTWLANNEECQIGRGGKSYKKCKYGIYINDKCGNRRDCLRGPGERCTEKMVYDHYGQYCAAGYYCHPELSTCIGLGSPVDTKLLTFVNPNNRYSSKSNPLERSSPFNYPIRARRQASI